MNEFNPKIDKLKIHQVPLSLIDPPEVPMRTDMDKEKMVELTASMKAHGQQSPILLRPTPEHRYEIVWGHRRTLVCIFENWGTVDAMIKEMSDEEVLIARAHENFAREDVTAIDEARYFKTLLDTGQYEVIKIGKMVGKKEGYVYQRLELLNGNPDVIEALEAGVIEFSHARELNSIENESLRTRLLHQAANNMITTRQIIQYKSLVESQKQAIEPPKRTSTERKEDVPPAEPQLYCDVGQHFQNQSEIVYIRICIECGGDVALDALRQVAFSGVLNESLSPPVEVDSPENSSELTAAAE